MPKAPDAPTSFWEQIYECCSGRNSPLEITVTSRLKQSEIGMLPDEIAGTMGKEEFAKMLADSRMAALFGKVPY